MSPGKSAAAELEVRIRRSIPLSAAMRFAIEALDGERIVSRAPLAPNVNIHGTGFAGSIYSLAVLTGWAYCSHVLELHAVDAELVVASAEIRYRRPVTGDIVCATGAATEPRRAFIDGVRGEGKGLLELEVRVGEAPSARLVARYCALAPRRTG